MATPKKIVVEMHNLDVKGKVNKYEVDDPRESTEPIKNIYISKTALKALGNVKAVRVTVEAIKARRADDEEE